MGLVEQGAKLERRAIAIVSPWAIRGGLISNFMNKYAALPMALTGTLSEKLAAKHVKETATFSASAHCRVTCRVSAKALRPRRWCA